MIHVGCDPDVTLDEDLTAISSRVRAVAQVIEDAESVIFGEVSVLVVSVERICELHARFFDDPSPTDVITFPDESESHSVLSGDIAICFDVAAEQAREAGHSLEDEIVFLATHGLLHLCGWDDQTSNDRERMLQRQSEYIERSRRVDGVVSDCRH